MWWFLLADWFGGTPTGWAASVGMFSGMLIGFWMNYSMAKNEAEDIRAASCEEDWRRRRRR